eukprot:gb/GEZN01005658.1/.p1 GENE.gb/GEZN01005658.1/~~gb/GEZN01005658.1/.p1  ORF type:complete len:492 (+),score=114.27 gb/GEZN01005658.1/:49-1524(+)
MLALARRHRRKLLLGGVLGSVAGGYYLYQQYGHLCGDAMMLWRDIQAMNAFSKQKKLEDALTKRKMMAQRFEHMLRVGDVTMFNFAGKLRQELTQLFDVEGLRQKLTRVTSKELSGLEKEQWDRFAAAGIARSISLIYAAAFLHALIKVQLSVVTRYLLYDSEMPGVTKADLSAAEEANSLFLNFADYEYRSELSELARTTEAAVQRVFNRFRLKGQYSREEIVSAVEEVRRQVEGVEGETADASRTGLSGSRTQAALPLARFIFPSSESAANRLEKLRPLFQPEQEQKQQQQTSQEQKGAASDSSSPSLISFSRLEQMVGETQQVLSSPALTSLLELSLDTSFALLLSQLDDLFPSPVGVVSPSPALSASSSQTTSPKAPFAKVMVRLTKAFERLLPPPPSASSSSELVADYSSSVLLVSLTSLADIQEFCAFIYYPLDIPGLWLLAAGQQEEAVEQHGPVPPIEAYVSLQAEGGSMLLAKLRDLKDKAV